MPRALILGVSIVTLVYIAVSVVFLYLVPPARIVADDTAFAALAGDALFGRVLNVLGQPIDGKGPLPPMETTPIRRNISRSHFYSSDHKGVASKILETGIKMIDLLSNLATLG